MVMELALIFAVGLMAAILTATIIHVVEVCGKWLKEYVSKKLKNKENHKVIFADTREVIGDYLKKETEAAKEVSMDELERMCEETPYVSAMVDENGKIGEYERIQYEEENENFRNRMKQQDGMVIIG